MGSPESVIDYEKTKRPTNQSVTASCEAVMDYHKTKGIPASVSNVIDGFGQNSEIGEMSRDWIIITSFAKNSQISEICKDPPTTSLPQEETKLLGVRAYPKHNHHG